MSLLRRTIPGTVIVCCVAGFLYTIWWLQNNTTKNGNPVEVTVDRLDSLAQACEHNRKLVGVWPLNHSSLLKVIQLSNTNILTDGWGREILFLVYTNAPGSMWLKSCEADGLPNGTGIDADIVYQLP